MTERNVDKAKASFLRFPGWILNLATCESCRKERALLRCYDFRSVGDCGCERRPLIVWGGRELFNTPTRCQATFNAATADWPGNRHQRQTAGQHRKRLVLCAGKTS